MKELRIEDIMTPEELAQLREVARKSLEAPPGTVFAIPPGTWQKLKDAAFGDPEFVETMKRIRATEHRG